MQSFNIFVYSEKSIVVLLQNKAVQFLENRKHYMHIGAQEAVGVGGGIGVCVDEAANCGVVISALEIIESGVLIRTLYPILCRFSTNEKRSF